jgi:hypothetical protein
VELCSDRTWSAPARSPLADLFGAEATAVDLWGDGTWSDSCRFSLLLICGVVRRISSGKGREVDGV